MFCSSKQGVAFSTSQLSSSHSSLRVITTFSRHSMRCAGVVFVALASFASALTSDDQTVLLRRELPGQAPNHSHAHNEKIEREAVWAERIARHEHGHDEASSSADDPVCDDFKTWVKPYQAGSTAYWDKPGVKHFTKDQAGCDPGCATAIFLYTQVDYQAIKIVNRASGALSSNTEVTIPKNQAGLLAPKKVKKSDMKALMFAMDKCLKQLPVYSDKDMLYRGIDTTSHDSFFPKDPNYQGSTEILNVAQGGMGGSVKPHVLHIYCWCTGRSISSISVQGDTEKEILFPRNTEWQACSSSSSSLLEGGSVATTHKVIEKGCNTGAVGTWASGGSCSCQ